VGTRTQRMTAAQLRLLLILALELVTNAVEQLHIALVRVLAERRDERPRHGACRFTSNRCIGSVLLLVTPYSSWVLRQLTKSAGPWTHST
jgi:hypothetical protein